jgi:cellulose synthase/poly-beta-1,6-N-acetylglucosamine synthase-like glycosyltransferase
MQLTILIIAVLLFISYTFLILYYRAGWNSIPTFAPAIIQEPSTSVSIIIPARNEEANIHECLETVLRQNYPAHLFEVLVVDDYSTDNTASVVRSFKSKNIRLISLSEHVHEQINSYKKKAIEIGIRESKKKLIVTTDADCKFPASWLHTIVAFYEMHHPVFIAAPVSIDCNQNFIEIFQSLDFMTLQGITGAAVHKNNHSMCNGANLAYERAVFYEVGGFKGIDKIASGDDMLLMHKIYTRYPQRVLFLKSKSAIVQTEAQKTVAAFFNQRIRWASKAGKYDDKSIFPVLLLVYLFNVMLVVFPIIGLLHNYQMTILNCQFSLLGLWIFLVLGKTVIEFIFLFPVAGFFNKRSLLWLFPIMQPFHIIYTVIAGWLGRFGTYEWKNRKVV